jgi:hypothetical protein
MNSKKDLVTGPIRGFCALHASSGNRLPRSSIRLWSTTTASRRRRSGRSRRPERGGALSATICGMSGRWHQSNRRSPTRSSPKSVAATLARLRRSGFGSARPRPSSVYRRDALQGRITRGGGALLADAPACDLAVPRGMGSVSRAEIEPGQERCSAESSERSSLATTPEPRRDRLGSLPTPHPRFPPPSFSTIGDLLSAGQTHDAELSLCLIGGTGDQRRRGRPADASPGYQKVRACQRPRRSGN